MKRIFLLVLSAFAFSAVACTSANDNGVSSDTTTLSSPEGMGADTTSAETDSLRDSLNR